MSLPSYIKFYFWALMACFAGAFISLLFGKILLSLGFCWGAIVMTCALKASHRAHELEKAIKSAQRAAERAQ